MDNNRLEEIKRFALGPDSIYDDVEYCGKWQGYKVYQLGFTSFDGQPRIVGLPKFVLDNGNSLKWAIEPDETFAIMDNLWKDLDEDNE